MASSNMSGAVVSACDELLEALKLRSGSSGGGMGGGVGAEALVLGMLRLKAGNREAMALLEKREAAVAAQREKNDQARLRLENLLYRQAYLAREIRACDDFATSAAAAAEKELGGEPLIQQSHSADLASRHKRSLNRLAEEFESRRDKRAALAELRAAYASETGALDKKRRFLEELPSRLKDVASAVAQVEQHVLTSGGNAAPAESAAAAMTGLGRSAVLEAAATLPAQLYTLFHGLHALQASISSGTAQTAVEVPAGFTLCAEHGSSSSTTQWAYRTNVVDLAALGTAVDLDLRINFTTTGSPATAGDTASVTLRFTVTSGNLVCVSTHGLSFAAMYPFKPEDLLYNLYPGDSSASRTYLWLQWACGLRPLPPTPLQGTTRYGSSLGTVIHRLFSRLQSSWRLSAQVQSMLVAKRLCPLPQSLHPALMEALGALADTTPVAPPADVLAIVANPFTVSSSASNAVTTSVPPQLTTPVATPASTIRQLQRADAPPLDVFAADPFRCVREASLAPPSSSVSGDAESTSTVNFVRNITDRECCVYYKLAFDLPSQPGAAAGGQPGMCLIEISPEYPVRPPQILLTSRTTVLNAGVQAQNSAQIDNAKKALESEVNAGCLSLISPDLSSIASNITSLDSAGAIASIGEALDATLTFQLSLLLSLSAVNNNVSMASALTASSSVTAQHQQIEIPSRRRGRNRRAGAIEGLYGRLPF